MSYHLNDPHLNGFLSQWQEHEKKEVLQCFTSFSRAGQLREKCQQGNTQVQRLQVSSEGSAMRWALL